MRNIRVLNAIGSLGAALLVFHLINLPNKIWFALISLLLFFCLLQFLSERLYARISIKIKYVNWIPAFTYLTCIAIFVIAPVNNHLFMEWGDISLVNWIGLVAALSLTMFFPGYVLLSIIKKPSDFIETVVMSYLLSLFITGGVYLIDLTLIHSLNRNLIVYSNLIFLTFYILNVYRREKINNKKTHGYHSSSINLYGSLTIFFTVLLVLLGQYTLTVNSYPIAGSANEGIFAHSMELVKQFPTIDALRLGGSRSISVSAVGYPYWISLCLASVYNCSVFPRVNTFLSCFVFTVMPFLAIFLAFSSFFNKKSSRIPVIATVLTLFPGYGWIYAWYLKATSGTNSLYQLINVFFF